MTDVFVVGEALVDIVVPFGGEAVEHVGGSPANVAIGLARLGHPTTLATHVGRDGRGDRILRTMSSEGVGLAPGSDAAQRTPSAAAHLDEHGHATYDFDIDWDLAAEVSPPPGSHVHTGSIAATLAPGGERVVDLVRRARDAATVSYDPNVRPSLMGSPAAVRERVETMAGLADVVKASDEDVSWLYGEAAHAEVLRRWLAAGAAVAVLTRGAEGALIAVAGDLREMRAPGVRVVDTVGAGDSFMSGLVAGLLDAALLGGPEARSRLQTSTWEDIRGAVQLAIDCSAVTVTRAGSNPPRRSELPAH